MRTEEAVRATDRLNHLMRALTQLREVTRDEKYDQQMAGVYLSAMALELGLNLNADEPGVYFTPTSENE
jgi:hypothetical protein